MFANRSPFHVVAVAFLGLVCLNSQLTAQGNEKSGQATDIVSTINLKFAGGTAQEYINAIQKQAGDVNILLDLEGRNVPMPAVELTAVNVSSAIMLLEDRVATVNSNRVILGVDTVLPVDQWGQPIYYVRAKTEKSNEPSGNTVISVKDILERGSSADDVLTAVSTTVELLGGDAQAEIRFHEPTGLLIARGQPDQMRAIHQVIDQIRESLARNDRATKVEAEARNYYQQLQEMKAQAAAHNDQMNEIVRQMTEAQTRMEMYRQEVDQARRQLEERESQLVASQARIRTLQEEVESLRDQLEKIQRKP